LGGRIKGFCNRLLGSLWDNQARATLVQLGGEAGPIYCRLEFRKQGLFSL
jgi:hypothetical protein